MRKRRSVNILILTFALFIAFSLTAFAAPTREADAEKVGSGCTMVIVPGKYAKASPKETLDLINSYRKEACKNGYRNPSYPDFSDHEFLSMDDYVEMKWSGEMEWIAQTRAAEGAVFPSHTRPNNDMWFSIVHDKVESEGENLAWTGDGPLDGINLWYSEKSDWINQTGKETGHYEMMIDPYYDKVGIGCFATDDGMACVAGEFYGDYYSWLTASSQGVSGQYNQKMEVLTKNLSAVKIEGKETVAIANKSQYAVKQTVTYYTDVYADNIKTSVTPVSVTWSVSDKNIATIDKNGMLYAKKPGTVDVIATIAGGATVRKKVTVINTLKSLWASKHEVGKVTFKWTRQPGAIVSGWKVKYRMRKIGGNNPWSGWTERTYPAATMQATINIPADYVIELHAKGKADNSWSSGIITTPAGGKYQAMKYAHVKNVATNKRITSITLKKSQSIKIRPDYDYPVKDYNKRPRLYPTHMLYDIGNSKVISIKKPDGKSYTGGIIDGTATIKGLKKGTTTLTCRAPNGRTKVLKVTVY